MHVADSIGGNVKVVLKIVGAMLVLFGVVWILQGIDLMPGSFMTGQIQWAIYGAIAVCAGTSMLVYARRRG